MPDQTVSAFTIGYNGLVNVLRSNAAVGVAFDPKLTPAPPTIQFEAIWDTGASNSVITQNVIQKCNLQPTGMTKVHTANGEMLSETYLISIGLPNGVGFPAVRVTEGHLSGTDMLIGMDIIGAGDFAISNFQGKTTFTYRYPSVAKTDYVQEVNQSKIAKSTKVGRNSSCPCGSGKKYKKCCGAAA